ncbi:MAG: hypothetical protein C0501_20045 [Isosphaera sp.]|nr:hypothetical protein [Isosphaera sp.]
MDAHTPAPPQLDHLLAALKAALAAPGEHRLFRSGKLAGLFPAKAGASAEAALFAVRDGLLETIRTEVRGKVVTEWVRATPKAVGFVHDHDTPKAVLRELKELLGAARAGVPAWMADAKDQVAALSARFEEQARATLRRLDDLANRVEAALRRAETSGSGLGPAVGRLVPWAAEALEYLDRRPAAGDCPLPELFHAVRLKFPELTLPAFQDGLRRLHDVRAVRLTPRAEMPEPEYAIVVGGGLVYAAGR